MATLRCAFMRAAAPLAEEGTNQVMWAMGDMKGSQARPEPDCAKELRHAVGLVL